MKYDSDFIDEACKKMLGHTNWTYTECFSEEKLDQLKKDYGVARTVIFFQKPDEEEYDG